MSRLRSFFAGLRRRDVSVWAAVLGVLPLPVWFVLQVLFAPQPAWRGEYRPREAGGPGNAAVVFEREISRFWDRNDRVVPGGLDVRAFSARWLGCLHVESAREVPFMLVASGTASFSMDGVQVLSLPPNKTRRSAGSVLRLEPGVHVMLIELDVGGWPAIALQASFDGQPPAALGSGRLAPGVRVTRPGPGDAPCANH